MFSLDQIKEAHAKVKTATDFAVYIQDLIKMGVQGYTIFVHDGHEEYFSADNFSVAAKANYNPIPVAPSANKERFIEFLVMHQEGQSDYLSFCNQAALCGIAKWSVDIVDMTCTYFDVSNAAIVIEKLPS